jgi:hypothetical protein
MMPCKIMIGRIFNYRSAEPYSVVTTTLTSYTVSGIDDQYDVLPIQPNTDGTAQIRSWNYA